VFRTAVIPNESLIPKYGNINIIKTAVIQKGPMNKGKNNVSIVKKRTPDNQDDSFLFRTPDAHLFHFISSMLDGQTGF
jgi:hypothetical protein